MTCRVIKRYFDLADREFTLNLPVTARVLAVENSLQHPQDVGTMYILDNLDADDIRVEPRRFLALRMENEIVKDDPVNMVYIGKVIRPYSTIPVESARKVHIFIFETMPDIPFT